MQTGSFCCTIEKRSLFNSLNETTVVVASMAKVLLVDEAKRQKPCPRKQAKLQPSFMIIGYLREFPPHAESVVHIPEYGDIQMQKYDTQGNVRGTVN